jgi:hypothetical protein
MSINAKTFPTASRQGDQSVFAMIQYAQPNDPQPMKEAIDTPNEMGVILEISI